MVEQLIQSARRRILLNRALSQFAFAAAVAIGGLALILLVGTRWLQWWTLTLFAAAGIAMGAWRIWRAAPDEYGTAIHLDSNAGLSDTLSTALHFKGHTGHSAEVVRRQREQAESAARAVNLDTAVPFTFPRTFYGMAACAVLASILLIVRLTGAHGLDLAAPITEVLFEDQAARQQAKQKQNGLDPSRRKGLEAAESLLAKLGIPLNPDDKQSEAALAKAIDEALQGQSAAGDKGKKGPSPGKSDDTKAGNGLEQNPDGDSMDGQPADSGEQNAESKAPGGQQGQPGDKGAPKSGQSGDNNSLLSKLKDAVSNMLSKAGQDKGDKNGAQQKGQQQQAKSDKGAGEKGSSGKGEEQQGEGQSGDPNGEPQDGQQAEGKAGSKSAQTSAQAGSGVGSQDGAKDLKAAEQLKAMGKISEIIGKRSATVTGETTIEVQSGNQQLRTGYSKSAAGHGEADSDVTRDEIPVALQSYVQQYFEQVRKSGATAKAKSKP